MYDQRPHVYILMTVWGLGLLLILQPPAVKNTLISLAASQGSLTGAQKKS